MSAELHVTCCDAVPFLHPPKALNRRELMRHCKLTMVAAVVQSGGSQLESVQVLLRDARQHAADLQTDKQQLQHMQNRLKQALVKVTLHISAHICLSVCSPQVSDHQCAIGLSACQLRLHNHQASDSKVTVAIWFVTL